MHRFLPLFALPLLLLPLVLIYQTTVTPTGVLYRADVQKRSATRVTCEHWIRSLNLTVPAILIDIDFLRKFDENDCFPDSTMILAIGVSEEYREISAKMDLNSRLNVTYFKNDTSKDYLEFGPETLKMVIPKKFAVRKIGLLEVPVNVPKFLEFWKRARFIECLNIPMNRTAETPKSDLKVSNAPINAGSVPRAATAGLALLRDELLKLDMFAFLNGGTLLGWYRECSVIPHTRDMDISVFAEHYDARLLNRFQTGSSLFKLLGTSGKVNDSFEMTVTPRDGHKVAYDIFLMYREKDYDWVGGASANGTKYKYTYPIYDPWCAADLHGRLFWVTCSPEQKLTHEYGPNWRRDHHSSNFSWYSSAHNVQPNGKWS